VMPATKTMLEPVVKVRDLLEVEHIRSTLETSAEMDGGMAVLEIALMDLALYELHRNAEALRAVGEKAVNDSKSETKKFYRAVAKAAMNGDTRAKELAAQLIIKASIPEGSRIQVKVRAYTSPKTGRDISEHWRTLPDGQKPSSGDEVREHPEDKAKREKADESQRNWYGGEISDDEILENRNRRSTNRGFGSDELDADGFPSVGGPRSDWDIDFDGLNTTYNNARDNETYQGGIQAFLSSSTWGQGIADVAAFLADTGGKFRFAARAIGEFGPIAGVRMAHAYFRYGGYDMPMTRNAEGLLVTEYGDKVPAAESAKKTREWAIDVLKSRLPGQEADNSGATPPSEGFIIDAQGNILAHGTGRGNDHFLPFSSRMLRKLRKQEGGEYVRRRMFGGPTAEDLHAAMSAGADRFTLVTNTGVFTVELTKRAHGLKMEHMQIVSRYQDILDTKNILNYDAYKSAIAALSGEFPLHVRGNFFAAPGEWNAKHDRIGPKTKFMDQLRNLFDVVGGGGSNRGGINNNGRAMQLERDRHGNFVFPGQREGQSVEAAFNERRRNNPNALPSLIATAKVLYRQKNVPEPKWLEQAEQMVRTQVANQQRQTGSKPSQSNQSTANNPRFTTNPQSQQRETYVAPVETRQVATPVEPPGAGLSGSIQLRPRAKERFTDMGLSPANFTGDPGRAQDLVRFANNYDDNQWLTLTTNDDVWNEYRRTFGHIEDDGY
jgi:hypothetical protein